MGLSMETLYDPQAEAAVLAACLESKLARDTVRKLITGFDLYDPRHEAIWQTIGSLERAGKDISPVSVVAALGKNRAAIELLPSLVTMPVLPTQAATHAEIVRSWAVRRRLHAEATRTMQQLGNLNANPIGLSAQIANRFAAIRDAGLPDATEGELLSELLSDPDDEPDWLIKGLLERRDRFMLTGQEGLGKSVVLRQIAVMAAAGLHPFSGNRIEPIRVAILDCENSRGQLRRKLRPLVDTIARIGGQDPTDRVVVAALKRIDIATDKALAEIHQLLDLNNPDLVVIGPLYRLTPRAINTDDEAAPLLAALDTIRDRDHSPALLIEAHAGHAVNGNSGRRDMRPRGSAALLGWPEFGYGLRTVEEGSGTYVDVIPWRGQRDEREWPWRLTRAHAGRDMRWIPIDAADLGPRSIA